MKDPRQLLIEAIISSRTSTDLYERTREVIQDKDGVINVYFFEVGVALINAFHDATMLDMEDTDEDAVHMPGREKNIN